MSGSRRRPELSAGLLFVILSTERSHEDGGAVRGVYSPNMITPPSVTPESCHHGNCVLSSCTKVLPDELSLYFLRLQVDKECR